MLYFTVLVCLCLAYAFNQSHHFVRRRKLQRRSWGDLLSSIQPVNVEGIAAVAECYLKPTKTQLRLEPDAMWLMVGKLAGLEAIESNAQAMLDLAVYAAQWNSAEGRVIGEMLRRDGIRLKKAVRRIQFGMLTSTANKLAAFDLQEAAATYHMMRGRVLGLYEVSNSGLYARLADRI